MGYWQLPHKLASCRILASMQHPGMAWDGDVPADASASLHLDTWHGLGGLCVRDPSHFPPQKKIGYSASLSIGGMNV